MRSRTFLHVSLGILALAAAYHLGARSAGAQIGLAIEGANVDDGTLSVAVNRLIYRVASSGDIGQLTFQPVPGSSPIITTAGRTETWAMTADGKAYFWTQGEWVLRADFATLGPTTVQLESWGSVKARYRGERMPVTTDR